MTTDTINLAEMSDEDVMNLNPEDIGPPGSTEEVKPTEEEDTSTEEQSADDASDQDNPDDVTGGADDDEGSSEEDADADSELADNKADPFEGESDDKAPDTPDADQAEDQESEDKSDDDPEDGDDTFESKYKQLMAPFRAAKREVTLDNIDDARRLMQMGVDYSRKMETMKPYLRVLRTLEKAELLDPSRINFLIDLDNNNPEAIKKLLKDNDIDPMTLNLEGSEEYSPTDHAPGDAELAVRDVLDNIKDSPKFAETVEVISKKMDKASRDSLQERPEVIAEIHTHIEAGIYQPIMDGVANERMYGRLAGLSDLEAYYKVGDAMHKAGAFKEQLPNTPSATGNNEQDTAQGSGSGASKAKKSNDANLRNRKRAAKPTKAKPAGGKIAPDFSKMSDEDIMKLDVTSF